MFNVVLRLSDNRAAAADHMEAHRAWIAQGFERGLFLAVGTLADKQGGGIWAYNCTAAELADFVNQDPFVIHGVAVPEIVEMIPARTDARLNFLKDA